VSRYQIGKTNLDFTEARDTEWQWHQLGHMHVCTSLQTDNHASTPPLTQFFTGWMPFLPPNQQRQSTEGKLLTEKSIFKSHIHTSVAINRPIHKKGKGSPHSITERRVPEPISVLGNQPAGDASHKPGSTLPLLSARPVVTLTTLKRAATNFAAW